MTILVVAKDTPIRHDDADCIIAHLFLVAGVPTLVVDPGVQIFHV